MSVIGGISRTYLSWWWFNRLFDVHTSNCRSSPHHVVDNQHLLEQTEASHISFYILLAIYDLLLNMQFIVQ